MACGDFGVIRGLAGLAGWSPVQQIETLITLAEADLVTTFIITQHLGALKRLVASSQVDAHQSLVSQLADGRQTASVGISHLTTSRRHLDRPVVSATRCKQGYVLDGMIPWVTGASRVDWIVVGASLDDGSQVLALVKAKTAGVNPGPGAKMIAMESSCTDSVKLEGVFVDDRFIIAGPTEEVLSAKSDATKKTGGAGGLQTSALALGLSFAALEYLKFEATNRTNLRAIAERFDQEHFAVRSRLLSATNSESDIDLSELRSQANSLVQRTTAAAMTTAKGAGLMANHPVARYCQQAFFFLVWSCPQPVAEAHLCEMAGL